MLSSLPVVTLDSGLQIFEEDSRLLFPAAIAEVTTDSNSLLNALVAASSLDKAATTVKGVEELDGEDDDDDEVQVEEVEEEAEEQAEATGMGDVAFESGIGVTGDSRN